MRSLEQLSEQRLAPLDWLAAQISTIKFKQIERAKHGLTAIAMNGKRDEKSFPARVIKRTPALSRRARMRNPSCLIS
jgi:hypothetical protein